MHKARVVRSQQYEEGLRLEVWIPNLSPKKIPKEIEVRVPDGRGITSKQRKLIYALFRDIAKWSGHGIEDVKVAMKEQMKWRKGLAIGSIKDLTVEEAVSFTEFTLEAMFEQDVPISPKFVPMAREVNNFFYLCLIHRKCCICGKPNAHIHHRDPVGRGLDRTKVDHTRYRLMALCGEQHHPEVHTIGQETFNKKYHVDGIKLNVEALKLIGLKGLYEGEEALEVQL